MVPRKAVVRPCSTCFSLHAWWRVSSLDLPMSRWYWAWSPEMESVSAPMQRPILACPSLAANNFTQRHVGFAMGCKTDSVQCAEACDSVVCEVNAVREVRGNWYIPPVRPLRMRGVNQRSTAMVTVDRLGAPSKLHSLARTLRGCSPRVPHRRHRQTTQGLADHRDEAAIQPKPRREPLRNPFSGVHGAMWRPG